MIITLFALIFESLVCSLFHITEANDMTSVSVFMLMINSIFVLIGIQNSIKDNKGNIRGIITISYILHIFVMLWNIYLNNVFTLPNTDGDAMAYASISSSYAFGGRRNLPIKISYYPSYIGHLYKIIGIQRVTAQFINVYLAIWSIVLIYKILVKLEIPIDITKKVITVISVLPNLLIISSAFLQESIVAFFVVASTYAFVKWYKSDENIWFIISLVFSLCGSLLHMGGIVPAVAFVGIRFLMNKNRELSISTFRIFLCIIALFVFLMFLVSNGSTFLGKLGGDLSADKILGESTLREDGGSGYFIGIDGLPAWLDLIVNTPIRMFYFIVSPVPWSWRGISDIFAFFGSTLFYIICIMKAIKIFKVRNYINSSNIYAIWFAMLIVAIVASIMFGWGVSNAGSALRHREKFTYLFGLLYALSLKLERDMYEESYSNNSSI